MIRVGWGLLVGWVFLSGSTATAQVIDRTRTELEAAGQATEADRLFQRKEWEQAIPLYEAERASRAALGDARYEAYALRAIGICRAELGDDESAIDAWRKARVLDVQREDKGYAGYDLFLIGQAELRLDRTLEGIKTLESALPWLSQGVDRDHEADTRLALTRTLVPLGRLEEARAHVGRALNLAEELKDAWRVADAWASSGQVEAATGHPALAIERFHDARRLFTEQERPGEAAWMVTSTGAALLRQGKPDLALDQFEAAALLHAQLEDDGSLAEDLTAVAGVKLELGRVAEALTSSRLAVEKAQAANDRPREVEARVRLAQIQGQLEDWASAAATLDEAVDLIRVVARNDPAEQVRLLLTAAETDRRANLSSKGRQRLDQAKRVADESRLDALKQRVDQASRRFEPSK